MSAMPHRCQAGAPAYKQAMRHCAGAVALVTVGVQAGTRTGMTVTAVCSLSDSPPSILVCVNRQASAHPRIRDEGRFVVNFLAEEHVGLARIFSGTQGLEGDARFAHGRWRQELDGAPVLSDAIAAFECQLAETMEASTHSVYIGRVLRVHQRAEARPLVYARGAFHGLRDVG